MSNKEKAMETFLNNGGKVKQCPTVYYDRITYCADVLFSVVVTTPENTVLHINLLDSDFNYDTKPYSWGCA